MDMAGCLRCDREVKTGFVVEDKVIYTYCSRRCYDLDARRGSYSAAGSTTVPALLRGNMAGQPPYAMPLSDAQLRSLSFPHTFIPNAGMGSMTTTPALSNSLSLASVSTYPQSVPSIPLPHSPSSTKSSNLLFHRRPSISSSTAGMPPVARAPASAPPYLAPHTQVTYHRANRSHHSPTLNSSTPANSFAPHHMMPSAPSGLSLSSSLSEYEDDGVYRTPLTPEVKSELMAAVGGLFEKQADAEPEGSDVEALYRRDREREHNRLEERRGGLRQAERGVRLEDERGMRVTRTNVQPMPIPRPRQNNEGNMFVDNGSRVGRSRLRREVSPPMGPAPSAFSMVSGAEATRGRGQEEVRGRRLVKRGGWER